MRPRSVEAGYSSGDSDFGTLTVSGRVNSTRTALPVGFDAANDEVEVDGVKCGITRQGWTSPQYPFNLTGHPALSLPSGFGADGLPTAVQIVGRWGAEVDVLRLGALLERARPWAQHRPPQRGASG